MLLGLGTLVVLTQPIAQVVYRNIGEKYGVEYSEDEIRNRFQRAYEQPWTQSVLRWELRRDAKPNYISQFLWASGVKPEDANPAWVARMAGGEHEKLL
ncbi:hypothetical protein Sjap_012767 [Stephania japonica]|uniref:Uncharacterized protein n=1 Tax=Stephania japonica TaxID=461633 RepID=A0AAP0IXV1_9MAGN